MKKLNSLIIDDEPLAHKVIMEYAKDIPFLTVSAQCYLATEAFSVLNDQNIDLIFLDIQMPKLKGLDFLRTLKVKPLVIVTSAYDEYALEGFELDVCDYLLKPFRFDRFLKAVNKAHELYQLKAEPTSSLPVDRESERKDDRLFIKSDKRLTQVKLSDIQYLESYGNYVKVWMGEEFHLTFRTLTSYVEELPEKDFFRIHKSFIINRVYIDYLEGNQVMMKNKKGLPIGKNNRSEFKKFLRS